MDDATTAFGPAAGSWVRRAGAVAGRPWLAAALIMLTLTGVLLATLPRPLSPDISGQLWIAGRLRHGARLYLDISEINPPLWFWLAMPVDALADLLGLRAEDVLIAGVGAVALASLLATDRLMAERTRASRVALIAYGACVLLIMPVRDLGQREQLALIGALPYAALIAARREGRPVPLWLALAVGSGGALGFALKHYFVGVPILLELWLLTGLRRAWRPWRPELVVLAGGAASYILAILIVTPGYLRVSVPELMLAYGATGLPSLRYLIRAPQPVWLLMGCGIIIQRAATRQRLSPITIALLIAALGFLVAWAIQHKGWPYQSIAVTGTLAMALATTLIAGAGQAAIRPRPFTVFALVMPLLLCLVPTQWVPSRRSDIAPALADLSPGATVAIVSVEGRTVWPATVNRGYRFVGRRGSFWVLAAVDANARANAGGNARGRGNPRIDALGHKAVAEALIDFTCLPPQRIVFTPKGTSSGTAAQAAYHPLDYFARDAGFARLLSHYRRIDLPGDFDAFALARPLPPVPATTAARLCPRGL